MARKAEKSEAGKKPAKKAQAAKKQPAQAPQTEPSKVDGYVSRASLNRVHLSPRKARLVVDMIRGIPVGRALDVLSTSDKKTGPLLRKLLLSAIHNAKDRAGVDVDELFVKRAWVNEGATLKRFMPRAHGRATPIRKRYSNITVVLDEIGV